jgi:hypothetical protein
MRYETIRGAVEFCFALAQYCKTFPVAWFTMKSSSVLWRHFMQWTKDQKQFSAFLALAKRRGVGCV